jgi:hypothetical protein
VGSAVVMFGSAWQAATVNKAHSQTSFRWKVM